MVDPLCWRRKSGHLHLSNNPSTFPSLHISSLRTYMLVSLSLTLKAIL